MSSLLSSQTLSSPLLSSLIAEEASYSADTSLDTRKNMGELESHLKDLESIKTNMLGVAVLMDSKYLKEDQNGSYRLTGCSTLSERILRMNFNGDEGINLAPNQKFGTELAPGFGSSFLVGENLIITAAHCIRDKEFRLKSESEIKNMSVVFNFHITAKSNKTKFNPNDVYKIIKILRYNCGNSAESSDWALLQLDRKVVDIKPIRIDFSEEISEKMLGENIYALGCPSGMAVKCVSLDDAKINKINPSIIISNLDVLPGNSGGPVINRLTGNAIGIVVRSQISYRLDEEHLKKTGKKQIIKCNVTREMIDTQNYPYAIVQRINSAMLNFNNFSSTLIRQGENSKEKLSNENSIKFEEEQSKIYLEAKKASPSLLDFIFKSRLLKNKEVISQHEQVKKEMQKNGINYKEAYHSITINKLLKVELIEKERLAIAKNMSAYNLTAQVAQRLNTLEVRNKCSSERILDFVEYCEIRKPNIAHLNENNILEAMQNNYPYHHHLKIEKDYRYNIVEKTLILENIRYLESLEPYERFCYDFIKKIATHYVTKYKKGMTFEGILKTFKEN